MKTCKVYCTYFGNRRAHRMLSPANAAETLTVFKKNIENDIFLNCGVDTMDIIIINNRSSTITQECVDYLNEINGLKTPYGKIIVHNRNNSGGSLGAYSYAFDQYQNDYDYWVFCEDDLMIIYDGYMGMVVNEFEDEELGFLAFTKINFSDDPKRIHVGGGFGGSSGKILSLIKEKYGKLRYDVNSKLIKNYGNFGYSEQYFTNPIVELGYKIRIPRNPEVVALADNWQLVESQIRWQNEMKFDLNNKKFLYHIGL